MTLGFSEQVVNEYGYDAWGNILSSTEAVANQYHFTTKELHDGALGLYFFYNRWYDPEVGRFVQRDPVLSINFYIYAINSPVNYIDPYGQIVVNPATIVKAILAWKNVKKWSGEARTLFTIDKPMHIYVSVRITKYYGADVAVVYGLGKELQDAFDHGDFEFSDLWADAVGIAWGLVPPVGGSGPGAGPGASGPGGGAPGGGGGGPGVRPPGGPGCCSPGGDGGGWACVTTPDGVTQCQDFPSGGGGGPSY